MNRILLDGRRMANPSLAHSYIKEEMNLSEYYGENLDALWDELTSISQPVRIVIINSSRLQTNLGSYGKKLLETFKEAGRENPRLVIKIKKWRLF